MKFLHLTVILTILLFACSSPKTPYRDSRGGNDPDRRDGEGNRSKYFLTRSEIPECSSGDCCEDDRNCKDKCGDYFSDSSSERICNQLPLDKGEPLIAFLEELEDGKADDFDEDDLEYFGLAMSIDHEVWIDLIKDYSDGDESLNWLAETDEATKILLQLNKDDTVEIIVALLGDNNDSDTLSGLKDRIDGDKTVLEVAENSNNNEFIDFIHDEIIGEELCTSTSNQPIPKANTYSSGSEINSANRQKEEACMLGVYCAIFPISDKENERKDIAQTIDDNDIESFIEDEKDDGGLSDQGSRISNANDWPDEACTALADLWQDSSSFVLW